MMQWSVSGTLAEIEALDIRAETTNNTCFVDLTTANVNANMQYCVLTFQYEIL
jgi:hypothetical protein